MLTTLHTCMLSLSTFICILKKIIVYIQQYHFLPLRKIPKFPGAKMFWKRAVSVIFLAIRPRLCKECLSAKFPYQEIR